MTCGTRYLHIVYLIPNNGEKLTYGTRYLIPNGENWLFISRRILYVTTNVMTIIHYAQDMIKCYKSKVTEHYTLRVMVKSLPCNFHVNVISYHITSHQGGTFCFSSLMILLYKTCTSHVYIWLQTRQLQFVFVLILYKKFQMKKSYQRPHLKMKRKLISFIELYID